MAEYRKVELAAELERARAQLARNLEGFRRDLNVPAHLKNSFRTHKSGWLGGAAIMGLLLAKLPARKKKIYVEKRGDSPAKNLQKAGLTLALAKMAFTAARPFLTKLALKKFTEYSQRRPSAPSPRG